MSGIPYTIERRPDTGVNNVQLGVWLFLASEAMLFGGLFSAYFTLRAGAVEPWQPLRAHLDAALVSTMLLVGGTAAYGMARRAAAARRLSTYRGWMTASLALSVLFVLYKGLQYFDVMELHDYPSTSTQWATYFLLTGVHALHVIGGALVNVWLLMVGEERWRSASPLIANRLSATALYWYFVDAIWLVLLVLIYVV